MASVIGPCTRLCWQDPPPPPRGRRQCQHTPSPICCCTRCVCQNMVLCC
jgi:hypothetical protein